MPELLRTILEIAAAVIIGWQIARLIWFYTVTEAGGYLFGLVIGLVAGIVAVILLPMDAVVVAAALAWLIVELVAYASFRVFMAPRLRQAHEYDLRQAHQLVSLAGKRAIVPRIGTVRLTYRDSSISEVQVIVDFHHHLANHANPDTVVSDVTWELHLLAHGEHFQTGQEDFTLYGFASFSLADVGYVLPIRLGEGKAVTKLSPYSDRYLLEWLHHAQRLRLKAYDPAAARHWNQDDRVNEAVFYERYIAPAETLMLRLTALPLKTIRDSDQWGWFERKGKHALDFLDQSPDRDPLIDGKHNDILRVDVSYTGADDFRDLHMARMLQDGQTPRWQGFKAFRELNEHYRVANVVGYLSKVAMTLLQARRAR